VTLLKTVFDASGNHCSCHTHSLYHLVGPKSLFLCSKSYDGNMNSIIALPTVLATPGGPTGTAVQQCMRRVSQTDSDGSVTQLVAL
jgi:hypothetical protein